MSRDTFGGASPVYLDDGGKDAPGRSAVVITPHATNAVSPVPQAMWVGTGGDITMRGPDDTADRLWKAVPSGFLLPFGPQYVRATGTTAADLLGIYNGSI